MKTPETPRTYEYWIPMIVFGAMTVGESYVALEWYPAAYILKAVLVTVSLIVCRGPLADIRPGLSARLIVPSVVLGLVVCVLWIAIDKYVPYPHLGGRTAFDPTPLRSSAWWVPFLAVRLYGLVLMVPIMEEVFWRSFLLRYLTQPDFRRLPMGSFSATALLIMLAASALAHPEWLVAIIASLAYALWLRRTGRLVGAIAAHAATNAALGAYVLVTEDWKYW